MTIAHRQPVIVGVGEVADRPEDLVRALDPADLMAHALWAADRDAGGGMIAALDRLDIINEISWPYPDPCATVADRLGRPTLDARYHPVGGQTPTLLLHEAALAIARGEIASAAICGGEAEDNVRRARRAGLALPWPDPIPDFRPVRGGDYQSPAARALELTSPVNVYPLYEAATRAAWGQTLDEAAAESATIWANNAAVARTRDTAWIKRKVTPAQILSPDDGNRLIASPYRKLMVANPIVNQGAAVILTSHARAIAMGVPEERLIYVHGGAAADEPRDILHRATFARSPAMDTVLTAAAGLARDGFDAVELYSCFPCVPKMARRVLDLAENAPLSVAGGLTFFGAPLNNYMTHAAVAMVERLRGGGIGLLYGQGEYVTKHHALVLGSAPAAGPIADTIRCDIAAAPPPPLDQDHRGPATVETGTILYDREEAPRHGAVLLRTAEGRRVAARVEATDPSSLAVLAGEEIVGARGIVGPGPDRVPCWWAI